MFTTYLESLEGIGDRIGVDGGMSWYWAARSRHSPWFHLGAHDQFAGTDKGYVVLMLDSIRALEAALVASDYRVVSLQAVMPGYMTGKAGWTMEPLSELIYTLDIDGMPIAECCLKDGSTHQYLAHAELDTPPRRSRLSCSNG